MDLTPVFIGLAFRVSEAFGRRLIRRFGSKTIEDVFRSSLEGAFDQMRPALESHTEGTPRLNIEVVKDLLNSELTILNESAELDSLDQIVSILMEHNVIELPNHTLDSLWYRNRTVELIHRAE